MNNLIDFLDIVKTSRDKKENIFNDGENICNQGISDNLKIFKTHKKEVTKRKNRLSFYANILKHRELTNDEIKGAVKKIKDDVITVQLEEESFKYRYFEGYQKGTGRYNKRLKFQIQDTLSAFSESGWETVALTLTCDTQNGTLSRFDAWKRYTQDINAVLENWRKHHNALYLWVKESTKNGYPHAHCVLLFPKGTIKGYANMPNRAKIYYGTFYKKIKSSVISPVFHLEKLSGDNVKYYLSKYINKSNTETFFSIADEKDELSDAQKKEALGIICTIATNSRLMGKSRTSKIIKELPMLDEDRVKKLLSYVKKGCKANQQVIYNEKTGDDIKPVIDAICNPLFENEELSVQGKRLRRFLIKLCTNSPLSCQKSVTIMKNKYFEKLFDKQMFEVDEFTVDDDELFQKKGLAVGCRGCYLSILYDFILNRYNQYADIFVVLKNGNVVSSYDREVQSDNALWCRVLIAIFEKLTVNCYGGKKGKINLENFIYYEDITKKINENDYVDNLKIKSFIEVCLA